MTDFQRIESLFVRLFDLLEATFSEREMAEVRRFFDVGEYGLALETVIDIYVDERKTPSQDQMKVLSDLSSLMEVDSATALRKLLR